MLVFIYHVWSKKLLSRPPPVADVETGSIDDTESDNRSDRTLRNSKKKKMPKMWDVRIPKLDHPAPSQYEQDDEDDDGIEEKDAGKWDMIKPMSVAYIKNNRTSASAPPDSPRSVIPVSHAEPTTPTTPSFSYFSAQQLESSGRRTAYDKATIEAVQVSVLISMPTKPGAVKTKAPMAGPLELGIAKIALDDDKRWKRRTGRPVGHAFAI